ARWGWGRGWGGRATQRAARVPAVGPDPRLSLRGGAIAAWPALDAKNQFLPFAEAIARHVGFSLDTPYEALEANDQRAILFGTGEAWISLNESSGRETASKRRSRFGQGGLKFQYKGLFPALDEASRVSFSYRHKLEHLVGDVPCATCHGSRLRDDSAASRFQGLTIGEGCGWPLGRTLDFFKNLKLTKEQQKVAGELLREIRNRLQFLVDVGLDYVTLGRSTPTLSGGESQRIRLASQIGSGLTGVLYVLDE